MIKKYLNSKSTEPLFLIGPNGSGKTYNLKMYQDITEGKSIYISEDGNLDVKMLRSDAIPNLENNEYLIYPKSKYYGETKDREEVKTHKIDPKLLDLIHFCKKEMDFYRSIKHKSKGQEKAFNIFNIIYKSYMNPIKYIFFDEPENYLDDLGLRKISVLFETLKKAKIKLIVSTHSYSLCNLLNVSINNIIFINKSFDIKKSSYKNSMIKLTLNDVKKIYKESTIDFENFIKDKKLDVDGGIRNKMHFYEDPKLLDLYLNDILKSEQFYRALFYKRIVLVEGPSENRIIRKLNIEELHDNYFYITYGKCYLIFFVNLFSKIGKEILIITDSDKKHKKNADKYNTAYGITMYLEKYYSDVVKLFDVDLESHFSIDKSYFNNKGLKPNEVKVYAADEYFSSKRNINKFIKFLNK